MTPGTSTLRDIGRRNPGLVTAVVSGTGYLLVIGTFMELFPYPEISVGTVDLLSHLIAVVNGIALTSLLLGFYWIRKRDIRRHRAAMLTAFILIILFLILYLPKVGGGGTKRFTGPEMVKTYIYLPVLGIHLLLSIVSVPIVVHAIVLGLSNPIEDIPSTAHPRVGRIAVAAWVTSLVLGIAAYVLLNHVYSWEYSTTAETLFYSLHGIA